MKHLPFSVACFAALFLAFGLLRADSPSPADGPRPLAVIIHIDVMPPFAQQAEALLWNYRQDSLKETGCNRVEVLQQVGRANHFTLSEEWADQAAYDRHIGADHTRQFRTALQPMLGSPFDERLHAIIIQP